MMQGRPPDRTGPRQDASSRRSTSGGRVPAFIRDVFFAPRSATADPPRRHQGLPRGLVLIDAPCRHLHLARNPDAKWAQCSPARWSAVEGPGRIALIARRPLCENPCGRIAYVHVPLMPAENGEQIRGFHRRRHPDFTVVPARRIPR